MKDFSALYSPEASLLRKLGSDQRGSQPLKILYHGLVVYVDREGVEGRIRYSCKVKVLGASDPKSEDWSSYRFYPPLFPPHVCALPEVGEEVLLLCEEPGNLDSAYWVSRVGYSNKLQRVEIGTGIPTNDNTQTREAKYGTVKLPTESDPNQPSAEYADNNPLTKVGDVVMQGRSNTYLRHSFDTKNLRGRIEIITEEETLDKGDPTEYRKSDGARILSATLSDLDTLAIQRDGNVAFDADFTKNGGQKNLDSAYLLLEAVQLRLISRQGKAIQHAVLAEEQERWLIALIDLVKDLIDDIKNLTQNVSTHIHMSNGPTSPPLNMPNNELTEFQVTLPQKFNTDKQDFEDTKTTIKQHHSQHLGIN